MQLLYLEEKDWLFKFFGTVFTIRNRGSILGTLVFLVLYFGFGINYFGDGQTIATIVSLDTISVILFLKFRKKKTL